MVLRIDLGGPALELVRIPDPQYSTRYAAEVDGVRVPIRLRRDYKGAGYSVQSHYDDWTQDMTMLLWDLGDIEGVEPVKSGDSFVFTFNHEQHYNAFKSGTITITYRDGLVEIDADITEQADSYY